MAHRSDLYFGKFIEMYDLFCNTLKGGIPEALTQEMIDYILYYDQFTYHYLRFISNEEKRPHTVYAEYRGLIANGFCNPDTFWKHIANIEAYLLTHELYEMMANTQIIKKRILKLEKELLN